MMSSTFRLSLSCWAVVLLLAFGASPSAGFDWITGANPATNIANTPYVATWVSSSRDVICMATIASSRMLITSAKCIRDYMNVNRRVLGQKGPTYIVAGVTTETELESAGLLEIADLVPYPRFSGDEAQGFIGKDIGLIFLKQALTFSNKIKAVQIPDFDPVPGYNMTYSGWSLESGSLRLSSGKLTLLNDSVIATTLIGNTSESNSTLKRIFNDDVFFGGDDVCGGVNTASPVVLSNYLFGIASRSSGPSCYLPKVFSRVARFSVWIANMQAKYETAAAGIVEYVLDNSIDFLPRPIQRVPVKQTKKRKPKRGKGKKTPTPAPTALVVTNSSSSSSYSVLVPRDLRSIMFQLSNTDGVGGGPLEAELRVYLTPRAPGDNVTYDCVSNSQGECKFFEPLEGVYIVEVHPLKGQSSTPVKLEARFEHVFGYRMVRSVYNSTLLPGKRYSYRANPVVPGPDFSATLLLNKPATARPKLLVGSGLAELVPTTTSDLFCNLVATPAQAGVCKFKLPTNSTALTLTVQGDAKLQTSYGLEFTYARFSQETKPGCPLGFACRAHYTLNNVPKGETRQYRKTISAASEFGLKLDLLAGMSEVRVFVGESDSAAIDNAECVLGPNDLKVGSSAFCSILVPASDIGEVRVFVKTLGNMPSSYEMTLFY